MKPFRCAAVFILGSLCLGYSLDVDRDYTAALTTALFDYENRRTKYNNAALANNSVGRIPLPIEAYMTGAVHDGTFADALAQIPGEEDADFIIVVILRVLFLTDGKYDDQALPVITAFPYWLTYGEDFHWFWTENHQILWMSSEWLLHERYGLNTTDGNLKQRLLHWLDLKLDYGFYEYFSSTYLPISLYGLLNLVDFCQDPIIQDKAVKTSERLLSEILLMTNDQGRYFPTAGRNYLSRYINMGNQSAAPEPRSYNALIWLLTGLGGEEAISAYESGAFLSTSSFPVENIVLSRPASVNMIMNTGHSIKDGWTIHQDLTRVDRITFQWSTGGLLHPDFIVDTEWLVRNFNLWQHREFAPYRDIPLSQGIIPTWSLPLIAKFFKSNFTGATISSAEIAIFRDGPCVLSSTRNLWPGYLGYQQWPWMATTGSITVWTQSGGVMVDWRQRNSDSANSHLPYVEQHDNVALIMYKPNDDLLLFDSNISTDVALYWPTQRFDEVREQDHWILGREGDGYIAVYRHCLAKINGYWACRQPKQGQTWAVVVGTAGLDGDFDAFHVKIQSAQVSEKKKFSFKKFEWQYVGQVQVGNTNIAFGWRTAPLGGVWKFKFYDFLSPFVGLFV